MIKLATLRPGVYKGYVDAWHHVYSPKGIAPAILTTRRNDNFCSVKVAVEKRIPDRAIPIMSLIYGPWKKRYHQCQLVFSVKGISPTLVTCGGGGQEVKIMEER